MSQPLSPIVSAVPSRVFLPARRETAPLILILLILAFADAAPAQQAVDDGGAGVQVLPPVTVTSVRSRKRARDVPAAIHKVEDIQTARPGLTLDEALTPLPGLFLQNPENFAQDLRISIRGFGARAPFGVRGVKVRVDGVSQTLPDGQTQLDALDPGLLRSIEVLRGPAASLYGNASGGVLDLATVDGDSSPLALQPRFVAGSFGLKKFQLTLGGTHENLNHRLFASHLRFTGHRQHSATENTLVNGKFRFETPSGADWHLTISHFNSPQAEDPGALTKEQAEADPEQARAANLLFSAGEQVTENQIALRHRAPLTTRWEVFATAHVRNRIFSNKLPFVSGGIVEFERIAPGLELRSVYDTEWFDRRTRLVFGVDVAHQRDNRQRFNNNQSVQGALTLDQIETVTSVGPYARQEMRLNDRLDLAFGLRYDRVHFKLDDKFLSDGDQSGSRTLSEWSGSAGAVVHANEKLDFYANVGTVFEVPTTTELIVNPSGGPGFNPDLNAQQSVSYEVGLKGSGFERTFDFDLALFFIRSDDEIIPFELPGAPGRNFFRNAGTSERKGVEASARYRPNAFLDLFLSYTYSDFEFTEFVSGSGDFSGKAIPGIPEHRLAGRLEGKTRAGWFGRFEFQHVADFFVDNANGAENDAYTATRLTAGREGEAGPLEYRVFLGLNNLLDESYNANTRINAAGGRFFEPAAPFNVFGGLALTWRPFENG